MANLVAAVTASQGRKRKCPACGYLQVVSSFLIQQPVTCRRCAATIPPPETSAKKAATRAPAKVPKGRR